ncbi:MAG: hypothetical protein ACLGQH_13220 [Acidobacteriota bacterium]
MKTSWAGSYSGLTGTIHDDGRDITGEAPGFVNAATQDFHITLSSSCIHAGTALYPDAYPVPYQYKKHPRYEPRLSNDKPDLRAFEAKGSLTPPNLLLLK